MSIRSGGGKFVTVTVSVTVTGLLIYLYLFFFLLHNLSHGRSLEHQFERVLFSVVKS